MTELTSVFHQDQPYYQLDPNRVMDAVEHLGFFCDGRIQALNSYENRVFQVGIEDHLPLILKFYRPERWSDAQILEEHQFCQELAEEGLSVVAPMQIQGESLFHYQGFRYALFPRKGGHAPELDNDHHLFELGRFLGRLHQLAERKIFQHRPTLSVQTYGRVAQQQVLESQLLQSYQSRYLSLSTQILDEVEARFKRCAPSLIRTQGDCHMGNMLWRDDELYMLDFDDCRMAPAMQDVWMLLTGDTQQQQRSLSEVVEGYEEYRTFPAQELQLVESLRALRIVYYSGWLAQRRADPAFIQAFPQFGGEAWWAEHIRNLEQQLHQLSEPSLNLTLY